MTSAGSVLVKFVCKHFVVDKFGVLSKNSENRYIFRGHNFQFFKQSYKIAKKREKSKVFSKK